MVVALALTTVTSWAQYAIVTGDDVRLRSINSTAGKILKELEIGTVGTVLQTHDKLVNAGSSEDVCDQAYWIKIRLEDGTEGWVFGLYAQTFDINKVQATYVLDGVKYNLHLGKSLAYPFDEQMCTQYTFPFLVPQHSPLSGGHLLVNKTSLRENEDNYYGQYANVKYSGKYWTLVANDALGQSLGNESAISNGKLLIDLYSNGQDSYKSLTVVEIFQDSYGRFIAKGISYQDLSE